MVGTFVFVSILFHLFYSILICSTVLNSFVLEILLQVLCILNTFNEFASLSSLTRASLSCLNVYFFSSNVGQVTCIGFSESNQLNRSDGN